MVAVQFPSPALSPVDVVESSLVALKAGDVRRCWRFMSTGRGPTNPPSRASWQNAKQAAAQPAPGLHQASSWEDFNGLVRRTPAYQPLVGCSSFSIVGALQLGEDAYKCRVRVWPAGGSSMPFAVGQLVVDYDWILSLQPLPALAADGTAEGGQERDDEGHEGCGNGTSTADDGSDVDSSSSSSLFWMVDGVLPDAAPGGAWNAGSGGSS